MKNVVVEPRAYDWEGDRPLRHLAARTIVYEMHVRGFTRHPNSGLDDRLRGTYAGVIEKIPYLQQLGTTAVELLPIYQFDAQDCPLGKTNYWGYAPIGFFAPHQAYSSRREPLGPTTEFRDMVKALHRAGIEVILDVVFNPILFIHGDTDELCSVASIRWLTDTIPHAEVVIFENCGHFFDEHLNELREVISSWTLAELDR